MEDTQSQPAEIMSQPPLDAQLLLSENQKLKKIGFIVGGLLLLVVTGVSGYYLGSESASKTTSPDGMVVQGSPQPPAEAIVACTMEALLCPDGSSVGRVGPNCEFAECPAGSGEEVSTAPDWQQYSDTTYSFKYPPTWRVEPGSPAAEKYHEGDVVTIISPTQSVSVYIAPSQSPYGFGGPMETRKGETLQITVNGSIFTGTENIRVQNGVTKVYVDMPVKIGNKEYYLLFGTGYPVNAENTASYEEYLEYRSTLLEVLSTLSVFSE